MGMERGYKFTDTEVRLKKSRRLIKQNDDIRELVNCILANGAYSHKEELMQLKKLDDSCKLCVNLHDVETLDKIKYEKSLLRRAWELRRKNADKAMLELEEILLSEGLGDKGNGKKEVIRRDKKSIE